jgi:hypothetical protein
MDVILVQKIDVHILTEGPFCFDVALLQRLARF